VFFILEPSTPFFGILQAHCVYSNAVALFLGI
jgi:hypothetical protein